MDGGTSSVREYEQLKSLVLRLRTLKSQINSNRIAYYTPIGNQGDFHAASTAHTRIVYGGNRSGKTTSGTVEAIAHALGERTWLPKDHPDRVVKLANGDPIPVPNIGRIAVKSFEVNVIQTLDVKMHEWAPKGEIVHVQTTQRSVPSCYTFRNGSKIYVMSYDQDDDTFEGQNGHWFWCDEPPPQRKYNGLVRGLVDFDGHCWITATPLSEPWISSTLTPTANVPGSGIRLFNYDIWDNCVENGGTLSRRSIESFLDKLPAHERAAREHGTPLHLAGLVFPEWSAKPPFWIDPVKIPSHWPRVCLIDPHPRKPIAVMWAACSPDNVWHIYRSMFDAELRTYHDVSIAIMEAEGWEVVGEKYDWKVHDMRPVFRATREAEQVVLRIIDTSANEPERNSGLTGAEEFASYGIYCHDAYKRNKSAGLNAIRTALTLKTEWAQPGIVVHNNCIEVKQNFENFIWDRWGSSKQSALKGEKQDVVKNDDDFIDLIRYLFQMRLTYSMLRSKAFAAPVRDDDDDEDNDILISRRTNVRRIPRSTFRSR